MKDKLNNRYLIISLGYVIFAVIIIFRLFNLQVVEGEKYNFDSQKILLTETEIEAPRGRIYDRNGIPLALNRQGFAVHIVKTGISTEELNEALLKFALILEKNDSYYNDSLSKYLTVNPISFNGKSDKEIKDWQMNPDRLNIEKDDVKNTAFELFTYLRDTKFKIDSKYTFTEAYKIMQLRYEILIDNWNFTMGGTVSLARNVNVDAIFEIEERRHELPGIVTSIIPIREYVDAYNEAHVLGYIRAITQTQYDSLKEEGYGNSELIGQTGVEKTAERYLKGRNGKMGIAVDADAKQTQTYETVAAIPGSDLILTIDRNLQGVTMDSLERNIEFIKNKKENANYGDADAGSAVVMNVKNGEILAMASWPSFDPQVFLESSRNQIAQQTIIELNSDTKKPQLNRTIQEIYAPGSTFKPLTAIAGLEKGIITPGNSRIYDPGHINIGGRDLYCLEKPTSGHGWLNLRQALETSCNVYFYELGFRTTIDTLCVWADHFGLGKKTGIDLPSEQAGMMSSIELKKRLRNDIWRPADTAQVAIGQFDNAFTPLQMACYIAGIANDGVIYQPHVIKKIVKYDGSLVNETEPVYTKIPVKQSTIDAVKEGMVEVTSSVDGTAYKSFTGLPFKVAGKTGTAQTIKGAERSPNALFVCYAPADDPEIVIVVVVERGAWGSNVAPIARDIIDAYFGFALPDSVSTVLQPEGPLFIK